MLQMSEQNLNFNAVSHDGSGKQYGSLGATYNGGNSCYFSINMDALDQDYIVAIKSDFDNFLDQVITAIHQIQQA